MIIWCGSRLRMLIGKQGLIHIPVKYVKARARSQRERCGRSSVVVAAVLGEAVFSRLCRSGIRLPGGRYEVDAYEEVRPDVLCLRCEE